MNLHQQERSAAARAFDEAIDQLHAALQAADGVPGLDSPQSAAPVSFDLNSFEQAAADIEQFIQAKANQASGSQVI